MYRRDEGVAGWKVNAKRSGVMRGFRAQNS